MKPETTRPPRRPGLPAGLAAAAAAALIYGGAAGVRAGGPVNATAEGAVPRVLDLNAQSLCPSMPGLPRDRRRVAGFTHAGHIALIQAQGKGEGGVCLTCHASDPREPGFDPCGDLKARLKAKGGPGKLAALFHSTCRSCHRRLKRAGETAGPVGCKGCHNRRSSGTKREGK